MIHLSRPRIRLREILYPSNLLTLSRLLMVPAILHNLRYPDRRWRAVSLVGVALLTDALDGPIARQRHEVSSLGQVIDPITDKLLLNATALILSQKRGFPWWATIALFVRDILILLGSALIYRRKVEIAVAQPIGKAATASFGAALLAHTIDGTRSSRPILVVALATLVGSVIVYARLFIRAIRKS